MCGIIGGNIFKNEQEFLESHSKIYHRGYDNKNFIKYNDFYIGHNRFKITGDENNNQPKESNNIIVSFNGEIFNSDILNDSEFLLKKYYNNNKIDDFFANLDGMFSISILDKRKNIVILGRDFIGKIPLYYGFKNNNFFFSSEKKCFDIEMRHVKPGTYIIFDMKNNSIEEFKYFDYEKYNNIDLNDKGEDFYTSQIKLLLENSLNNEYSKDIKYCSLLSGGVDSSIISYLLSKKNEKEKLNTFCINFDDNRKSIKRDLTYSIKMSEYLNSNHHVVNILEKDTKKYKEEFLSKIEETNNTQLSLSFPLFILSKKIKEFGFDVCYTGDIADELFASYSDVIKYCWREDDKYVKRRLSLVKNVCEKNLKNINISGMIGGPIEFRSPFGNKELVDFCLRIPAKYRDENNLNGKIDKNNINGNTTKYLLRKAFEDNIPNDILWRKKVPFQIGCGGEKLFKI